MNEDVGLKKGMLSAAFKEEEQSVHQIQEESVNPANEGHEDVQAKQSQEHSYSVEGGFMFVPVSGQRGSKYSRGAARTMRAHVMRKIRQRNTDRPLAQISQTSLESSDRSTVGGEDDYDMAPSSSNGRKYRYKLGMTGSDPSSLPRFHQLQQDRSISRRIPGWKPSSPNELSLNEPRSSKREDQVHLAGIGDDEIDPFGVVPLRLSHWDQTLINLWRKCERNPWCPINGRSPWFLYAMRDELLLHASLYAWAIQFAGKLFEHDSVRFLKSNPRALEHKGRAIRMINERLSNPEEVRKDELLAAVAVMLNVEITTSSEEQAVAHINGLSVLVRVHGGLMNCPRTDVQHLIMRLISWNDLFFGEIFGGPLRFSTLPQWDEALYSMQQQPTENIVSSLEPFEPRFSGHLASEVSYLLAETRKVAQETQLKPFLVLSEPEKAQRRQSMYGLGSRSCLSTKIAICREVDRESSLSWRAVAVAIMIYIHHNLHDFTTYMPMAGSLVNQLRNIMLSRNNCWQIGASLHIWVLSVGAFASNFQSCFIQSLAAVCATNECKTWSSFVRLLNDHPWKGEDDETKFLRVWKAVEPILNSHFL